MNKAMVEAIETRQWIRMLVAAAGKVSAERDYLSQLDSTVGDGDHGANLARALQAVASQIETMQEATPAQLLKEVGTALQGQMGGAAGVIFGGYFLGMASELDSGPTDGGQLAAALSSGLAHVQRRGRAEPGGKTVVDALVPAVAAAATAAAEGTPVAVVLRRAADAARTGAAATQEMVARYGRAKFLGERSLGYQDAGATSMSLIMTAMATALEADSNASLSSGRDEPV